MSPRHPDTPDRSQWWLSWRVLLFFLVISFFFWGQRALWESSEGRYGEVGREMVVSGDWLVPTIAGHLHMTKPPYTYWMIAGGMKIFGVNEWGARFFLCLTFFGTILCVGELAWTAGFGRKQALAAAVIYATGAMTFASGRVLTTDAFLTFWETLGILGAWKVWWGPAERRSRWRWVFWLAFGMAFLTKGPPGWLPFLAIIAFQIMRRDKDRPRLFGVLPFVSFLFISLSWYLTVIVRRPELLEYFLKDELIDRVATNVHQRDAPFYIYYPILLLGPGPWILLWPEVFRRVRASWKREWRLLPDWQFFAALWVLLPFVVFEFSKSRMPLYVLPLFAPICLAFGRVAPGFLLPRIQQSMRWRQGVIVAAAIWLAALALASVYPDGWPGAKSERQEGLAFRKAIEKIPGEKRIFLYEMSGHHSLAFYMNHTVLDVDLDHHELRALAIQEANSPGRVLYISKQKKLHGFQDHNLPVIVHAKAGDFALVEIPGKITAAP